MDWKEYEQEIAAHFGSEYPSAHITANARILGKHSKVDRQIDLLLEQQVCDLPFRIVVDAKYRKERIDVKDVEEFLGLVQDVCAHKGVLISVEGYTEAAIRRAAADDADVILDILNFKELQESQGLCAIAYAGSHAAVLDAPLGWVVDATQGGGALAWLYQRGQTLHEAMQSHEFMYVNFCHKKELAHGLESLIKYQEAYMVKGTPVTHIELLDGVPRTDVRTAIRAARFQHYLGMAEYTGFVDFDGFVFMCVLFAPDELAEKNLSKLRFIMRKVFSMNVVPSKSEKTEPSDSKA